MPHHVLHQFGAESRLHQSRAADVPQRMRGQHDGMVWADNRIEAVHRGLAGVVDNISVQWLSVSGQADKIGVSIDNRFLLDRRAIPQNRPQRLLGWFADWYRSVSCLALGWDDMSDPVGIYNQLFVDCDLLVIKINIIQSQATQFADPQPGIEQNDINIILVSVHFVPIHISQPAC